MPSHRLRGDRGGEISSHLNNPLSFTRIGATFTAPLAKSNTSRTHAANCAEMRKSYICYRLLSINIHNHNLSDSVLGRVDI